jgi:hypothetical protein
MSFESRWCILSVHVHVWCARALHMLLRVCNVLCVAVLFGFASLVYLGAATFVLC